MLLDRHATRQHCKEAHSRQKKRQLKVVFKWVGFKTKKTFPELISGYFLLDHFGVVFLLFFISAAVQIKPRGLRSRTRVYLIDGTHPRDGSNVVCDGDQRRSG